MVVVQSSFIPLIELNMKLLFVSMLLLSNVNGFTPSNLVAPSGVEQAQTHNSRVSPLFMGRAAAVRAATKSKTDAVEAGRLVRIHRLERDQIQ